MKDGDHLHWVRMQVERPSFFVPGRDVPDVWMRIFWGGFFWWQLRNGEVLSGYALMIPL